MQTENNQVDVIMNSIEVLKTGPQILIANQIRKDKAIQVGENILAAIAADGMSQAADERAMNYLSNLKTATVTMKEDRAGITQIMSNLAKMYTEVENTLDINKAGTVPAKVQAARNMWAKYVAAEKEVKRKAAELVANKAKEEIELKSSIAMQFSTYYNDFLAGKKQGFQNSFNAITLENFGEKALALKSLKVALNIEKFQEGFGHVLTTNIHQPDEISAFIKVVCANKIIDYTNNYAAEISILLDEMIEKLPSKLTELTAQKKIQDDLQKEQDIQRKANIERAAAIADAGKLEKEQLEKDAAIAEKLEAEKMAKIQKESAEAAEIQQQREAADAAKIAADNVEKKRLADLDAEVKKQGEQTMAMFDQEAAVAELGSTSTSRQGVEISVLHPVGYTQIFALWFEGEGKNLPIDKLGNTKLDQMKAWCEKKALKDNTRIETKFLQYEDSFKAINKKAK